MRSETRSSEQDIGKFTFHKKCPMQVETLRGLSDAKGFIFRLSPSCPETYEVLMTYLNKKKAASN